MRPALAPHLPIIFDLLGVLTAASAGALTGVRKNLDMVGVLVLAAVTGLGGGVVRDLMIGAVPVAMLTDWRYLTAAAVAAGSVLLVQHPRVRGHDLPGYRAVRRVPLATAYLVADSATLGCFAVSGTAKSLDYGLAAVPAALMGVVTAVGGGVLRDVLVNEVPTVLRRELYAVPALVGSLVVAATDRYAPAATAIAFLAAAVTMGLRLVAVRRDWHARLPMS